jgi:CheY-like chemotaxis protein
LNPRARPREPILCGITVASLPKGIPAREERVMGTILIVEDNPMNMELARDVLEAHGYRVRGTASATEALEVLRETLPDLILMDVQLPGLDGLELTRSLKQDPRTRDIIVVALTAHAMKGDRERILEAGCSGYIAKPIDTRALCREVARHLPPPNPPVQPKIL